MAQPLFALSNMLESSPLSRGMHWEHDLRVRIVESSSLMQPLAMVPQVRQGKGWQRPQPLAWRAAQTPWPLQVPSAGLMPQVEQAKGWHCPQPLAWMAAQTPGPLQVPSAGLTALLGPMATLSLLLAWSVPLQPGHRGPSGLVPCSVLACCSPAHGRAIL